MTAVAYEVAADGQLELESTAICILRLVGDVLPGGTAIRSTGCRQRRGADCGSWRSRDREQLGHRLGAHAGAAIGMQGERARRDELLGGGVADQLLGQFGAFACGDQPADDVAAEEVQDHVQVKAGPLARPLELGDIPAPHFARTGRQ